MSITVRWLRGCVLEMENVYFARTFAYMQEKKKRAKSNAEYDYLGDRRLQIAVECRNICHRREHAILIGILCTTTMNDDDSKERNERFNNIEIGLVCAVRVCAYGNFNIYRRRQHSSHGSNRPCSNWAAETNRSQRQRCANNRRHLKQSRERVKVHTCKRKVRRWQRWQQWRQQYHVCVCVCLCITSW